MFDIGFWEIIMVGVVALLVIGPKELPTMMRTVGGWMGKTRHFVNAIKTEIEREAYRADELKRLLAEQAGIVERHKNIDPSQPAVPIKSPGPPDNSLINSPDYGLPGAVTSASPPVAPSSIADTTSIAVATPAAQSGPVSKAPL